MVLNNLFGIDFSDFFDLYYFASNPLVCHVILAELRCSGMPVFIG
jgi:hypothetical protein